MKLLCILFAALLPGVCLGQSRAVTAHPSTGVVLWPISSITLPSTITSTLTATNVNADVLFVSGQLAADTAVLVTSLTTPAITATTLDTTTVNATTVNADTLTVSGSIATPLINGLTIASSMGQLAITSDKQFTVSQNLTLTSDGTGTRTLNVAAGGTLGAAAFLTPLAATATLDFPSTATQAESDLTISLTGAALSDPVVLGVPHGSTAAGSAYSAWVSAANTITVRFSVYGATTRDPASGSFKVQILK